MLSSARKSRLHRFTTVLSAPKSLTAFRVRAEELAKSIDAFRNLYWQNIQMMQLVRNTFSPRWYTSAFMALGFVLIMSIYINVLRTTRAIVLPLPLVESFETHLNEARYQEAYDLAKNDESMLGQVLSAGLAMLSTGYPRAIAAMNEVREEKC